MPAKQLKKQTSPRKARPAPSAKAVLAYLQAHPQFLKTHAATLVQPLAAKASKQAAPKRIANIFSLQAARAGAAEDKLKALKKRYNQLICIARDNTTATAQAHAAVLSILGARTAAELSKALQGPFKQALGLHGARLLRVGPTSSATTLTAAELAQLCPQPLVLGPYHAAQHGPLFGPQGNTLKSSALLRLEAHGQLLGLFALGSEDAQHFHAGQGTDLLEFLRQVVSLRVAEH
ncbi:MAG: DUF484 family protein [Alphaproteobacteria bacterium]|nr:DUF484 family protein [Alphaproteobacteria bacterium]